MDEIKGWSIFWSEYSSTVIMLQQVTSMWVWVRFCLSPLLQGDFFSSLSFRFSFCSETNVSQFQFDYWYGRLTSNLFLFVLIEQNKCHPNPCRNGGTCTGINEGEGFECTCREGFKGKNCEGENKNNYNNNNNTRPFGIKVRVLS